MAQSRTKSGRVRNDNAEMRKCFTLLRMTEQEEKENPVAFNPFFVKLFVFRVWFMICSKRNTHQKHNRNTLFNFFYSVCVFLLFFCKCILCFMFVWHNSCILCSVNSFFLWAEASVKFIFYIILHKVSPMSGMSQNHRKYRRVWNNNAQMRKCSKLTTKTEAVEKENPAPKQNTQQTQKTLQVFFCSVYIFLLFLSEYILCFMLEWHNLCVLCYLHF